MAHHKTQAMILAEERAGHVARRAIKNIEAVRRMAEINVYGVMAISYLHQAMYLWALMGAGFGSLHGISGAVGSVLIPIAFDIFAVICIKAGTTVGLARGARRWGLGLLALPTAMSGYVNVRSSILLANGWIIASIYVGVVAMIPVVEFLRSKMNDIDYDAIDAIERRTLAVGTTGQKETEGTSVEAVSAQPLDQIMALVVLTKGDLETAKRLAGYDGMDRGQKQSFTRRWANAKAKWEREMSDPAAAASSEVSVAPVSPGEGVRVNV